MKSPFLLSLLFIVLSISTADAGSPNDTWSALRALVGTWEGVGGGAPGAGGGEFSFKPDLGDQIIVRKNHTEYPAAEGRPAAIHDDLMIAYQDDSSRAVHAIYFDNEGHVINYAVESSPDGKTVTFLSDPQPGAPRFRLTYEMKANGEVSIIFSIAPPGKAESFKTYLEGKAKRTN
jgi:hypothetical protein